MDDPDGFAEFVAARQSALLRMTFALTGDRVAAEDLAQTALVKLWPHWRRISAGGDPWAYLRRIVLTTHAGWWRRHGRSPVFGGDADWVPAQGDALADADDRAMIRVWLRGLPPRQRAVIVARYLADMSVQETADALRCSTGTVKSQTAKALHHLRAVADSNQHLEQS